MVNCISQEYKDMLKSMLDQHIGEAVISAFLSVVPSCEKVRAAPQSAPAPMVEPESFVSERPYDYPHRPGKNEPPKPRSYKCLVCGKDLGEVPLTEMCAECFDRYRKDKAFREAYHRKHPRREEE